MKIIPIEQKEKVLACFRQKPVPSFTEISKQTGVHRVTIYHWFEQFEKGDLTWSEGGRRTFGHYPRQVKAAVVQTYLEGNHTIKSLTASYGLRSESTVLNWVSDHKKAIGDGTPLIKRKGGKQHREHRDIESMTDREIKIENVFLRAYVDELLKEVPDT